MTIKNRGEKKMKSPTHFNEIVKLIADGFREDVEFDGFENLREYFKVMGFDREDYISEFKSILDEQSAFDRYNYTDEMEILEDGKTYTLEELIRKVKAYKF